LAFIRFIGTHLARITNERRAAASVSTVARELALIGSPHDDESPAESLQGCAPGLLNRSDVGFITDSVRRVLQSMVRLSGAMSVTCRLIVGTGDRAFARSLLRVHCEGRDCALDSPDAIDLDDWRNSVNAWVARHGSAVYLRAFPDAESPDVWEDLGRYPELEGARLYREGVCSELCVPILAEGRVVGTINLEADTERAFDLVAETVEEYAQLIGIALVEARRRIGVSMMAEAGGFLNRRHILEGKLEECGTEVNACSSLSDETRQRLLTTINELTTEVLMHRTVGDATRDAPATTLLEVLQESMRSIRWTYSSADPSKFAVGDLEVFARIGATPLARPVAQALEIAVNQVLLNVRKHGTSSFRPSEWSEAFGFSFGSRMIGGVHNVGIAVHSVCEIAKMQETPSQKVFREPIHRGGERTSLGAFVAGEVVRRVGGAAYFSWRPETRTAGVATAEIMVPIAPE